MPTFSPNLPTLLALVLLVPLAACRPLSGGSVTSRALPSDQELGSQLDGSSLDDLLDQLGASVTGVWQNYTRESNTFYLGPSLVDASTADSDEACAQRCNDSPVCTWWAFCAQTQGCSFLTYCNITGNATDQKVASGSCILSGENRAERRATNVILTDSSDSSFGWYSGVYQPITSEQGGGNTSAFSDISGLGARRKLRQLSGASAAANSSSVFQLPSTSSSPSSPSSPSSVLPSSSVWDQFTNTPNSFTRGPTMLPLATADTAENCAIKCLDNAVCRQWAWCPTERGQEGCDALEWCTAQNAGNVRMPASTCLLTYDDQAVELGRLAYVDMVGSNVTWTSGSYHGSNGGSDAPSGGPSASPATPSQSPSPSPDVSPSPSPSPDLSPEPSSSPSSSLSPSPGGSFPPTSDGGCPEGTKNCGGSQGTLCILVQQDRMNCGFCGNMCPSGQSCMGGLCSCPAGQRQCGIGCANILTDTYNCGTCGYSCPLGQSCMAGACF